MSQTQIEKAADELAVVLERLGALQEDLLTAIESKLEAMRRSDVDAMTRASHREGEITSQVSVLDQKRCLLAAELCRLTGLPIPARAQNVTLRSLCSRLEGAARATLSRAGTALQVKMLKAAEANRVVELVCREMLAHFRTLFQAFMQDEESPRVYSQRGAIENRGVVTVLDAVG